MNKLIIRLVSVMFGVVSFLIISVGTVCANTRLLFYLNPAPLESTIQASNDVVINKINKVVKKTPYKFSRKVLKERLIKDRIQNIGGFLALYGGYMDFSDKDGQISFPLRHQDKKLYLVITPDIELVTVKGNTVSHMEFLLKEKNYTEIYSFKKKKDIYGQRFWRVEKEKIPENNIISSLSVVLLTRPKNIYVSTGDFMANDNKHIILPGNIYAVGSYIKNNVTLNFINKNKFFEPIEVESKEISNLLYQKIILNN